MGIDLLLIIKWYVIIGLAFVITSLFTLHFPAWSLVKEWAAENLPNKIPNNSDIFIHTIAYFFVSFIVYPVLAAVLLISNKDAIVGYSKSLIKDLIKRNEEDDTM